MELEDYEDFLKPRRIGFNYLWVSRTVHPKIAFKQGKKIKPEEHKVAVLRDPKIIEFVNHISQKTNTPKEEILKKISLILDEIAFAKNLNVSRWLALVLTKICLKVNSGVFVNTEKILHLKQKMGNCPVIFLPTHRSYADFIMMTYLCFVYDITLPAVAAGMDFQGMMGMGEVLRKNGAFFMRRSYNNDDLYWTVFKQYINQIVTNGDSPIEFFIEGTRSRSNKSLSPKYGLLNMVLKPLFLRQIPDILFVPINVNYDRILEENLFAYELLGVPKPKESTSGFFKSLSIVKEKYGSIYFHFAEPFSARQFFGTKFDKSLHNEGPIYQHELSEYDKSLIPPLAHKIIKEQQKNCVLNTFNICSVIINHNLRNGKHLMTFDDLVKGTIDLNDVLVKLGAITDLKDAQKDIQDALEVHKNLIKVNADKKVTLVYNKVVQNSIKEEKLKGHRLRDDIMTFSVPFTMLHIYINPVMYFLVDSAILVTILSKKNELPKDVLLEEYKKIRHIFINEFTTFEVREIEEFETALNISQKLDLISKKDNFFEIGTNQNLQEILVILLEPFIYSYSVVCNNFLNDSLNKCEEKIIFKNVQKIIEEDIELKNVHPFSLNLDTISHCLCVFTSMGLLKKQRENGKILYTIFKEKIEPISILLESLLPSKENNGQTLKSVELQFLSKM